MTTGGDMDRPGEGDLPGAVDDAVWTELVASFHASTADRPGLWPDAENLPGEPGADAAAGTPGAGGAAGGGSGSGGGSGEGGGGTPGYGSGPASGAQPPQASAHDAGTIPRPPTGADRAHPAAGGFHGAGAAGVQPTSASATPPSRVVRPAARPGQEQPPAPPAVTWTAAGPRDYAPADPDDDGYTPPPPPPLPELGMATKAAWLAGLGGPGYLTLATIAHWETPQWAALLCVLAGVAGFGYLVSKLKDRPDDEDDDPEDPNFGAVL
jgi:hypothetical protein